MHYTIHALLYKLCDPAILDGRAWCKIGKHGEHGEHGKHGNHRPDDLKHSFCQADDSKHSICGICGDG